MVPCCFLNLSKIGNLRPWSIRKFGSSSIKMLDKLVWVDCEMSGLDANRCQLLEVALVITNSNLQPIDQFGPIQIRTTQEVLDAMNDWCKKNFNSNGLAKQCLQSNITIEQTDSLLSEFMIKNRIKQGILAGNSIATDRIFLDKYCPKFVSHLHYRMLDVSAIKVLVNLWYQERELWNKPTEHRALDDIFSSIEELKFYREKYFIKST